MLRHFSSADIFTYISGMSQRYDLVTSVFIQRAAFVYFSRDRPFSCSQTLLAEGVDINILDYKGATPLHRAKDAATVEV